MSTQHSTPAFTPNKPAPAVALALRDECMRLNVSEPHLVARDLYWLYLTGAALSGLATLGQARAMLSAAYHDAMTAESNATSEIDAAYAAGRRSAYRAALAALGV